MSLYAGIGGWRPEGPQGAPIEIAAFGEEGADPSIPGPLIRVREGTSVVLTLRNTLGSALRVNGLSPDRAAAILCRPRRRVSERSDSIWMSRNLFLLGRDRTRNGDYSAASR